jgi:hypothetical protein
MISLVFGDVKNSKELSEYIYHKICVTIKNGDVEDVSPGVIESAIIEYATTSTTIPLNRKKPTRSKKDMPLSLIVIEKFGETSSGVIGKKLLEPLFEQDVVSVFKELFPKAKMKKNRPGEYGDSYSFSSVYLQNFLDLLSTKHIIYRTCTTQKDVKSLQTNDESLVTPSSRVQRPSDDTELVNEGGCESAVEYPTISATDDIVVRKRITLSNKDMTETEYDE